MIAYYIHWIYPPEADNELFYGGRDDLDNLFHHKENAEKFAKKEMTKYEEDEKRCDYLNKKDYEEGLTPEENMNLQTYFFVVVEIILLTMLFVKKNLNLKTNYKIK